MEAPTEISVAIEDFVKKVARKKLRFENEIVPHE